MRKRILFFYFLSISFFIKAQDTQYQYFPVEEGLITHQLKSLVEDGQGMLWGASDHGLFHFNGIELQYFPSAFPTLHIKSLHKQENGNIWVVHDLGLGQILLNHGRSAEFQSFWPGSFQFSDSTLYYPKMVFKGKKERLLVAEDSNFVWLEQGTMKRVPMPGIARSPKFIRSHLMAEDGFGHQWFFSFTGEIMALNENGDTFEKVASPVPLKGISEVKQIGFNYFLLACESGLIKMEVSRDRQIKRVKLLAQLPATSCFAMVTPEEYLAGTWEEGLYKVNLSTGEVEGIPTSNNAKDIIAIEAGKEGWWIGSSEALGQLRKRPFQQFKIAGKSHLVESIYAIDEENLIFSEGQRLRLLKHRQGKWQLEQTISTGKFSCRIVRPFQSDWIMGTYGGQLYRISNTAQVQPLGNRRPDYAITALQEDQQGQMWAAGNRNAGLLTVNEDWQVFEDSAHGINFTSVIRSNLEGDLFAAGSGTEGPFFKKFNYNEQQWENWSLAAMGQSIEIRDMLLSPEAIFLATSDGLWKIHRDVQQKLERMLDFDLLGSPNALGIARTPNGYLWVATDRGLFCYQNGQLAWFDKTNGLPSNSIKERGLEVDYQGDLWVATDKSLVYCNMIDFRLRTSAKPEIRLSIAGNAEASPDLAGLPFRADLTFNFQSNTFPAAGLSYRYRLLPTDSSWSKWSKNHELSYLNFDPGDYALEVQLMEKGKFASEVIVTPFHIKTPWYATSIFRILMLIFIILLLWMGFKIYANRLKKRAVELQKMVNDRTRELQQSTALQVEQKNQIIQQQEEMMSQQEQIHQTEKALSEAEVKNARMKATQLEGELQRRNRQMTSHTLNLVQKNAFLESLKKEISGIEAISPQVQKQLKRLNTLIDQSYATDQDWEEFQFYFEGLHANFYSKLKLNHPDLSSQDLKHCALIRLNLSLAECASLLGISADSVKTSRYRLKKKLGLTIKENLQEFILTI
ncbi:triple tyrosine motif-containing protein [Persicobacter diffluens]|uniref:Two component regulator three Y domain-containing protein n=1 Tax=Persicobacter diffluens TaxID=981 RepID=A0AAN5ALE7_9BACT|nr:hypothetical protein PEDI_33090 [Persicobacter diffluens]